MKSKIEEDEEKFCPNCGRTLTPDTTHCPVCGKLAEIRQTGPVTTKPKPVLAGQVLVFAAGFIGLISVVTNFGSAYVVAEYTMETGEQAYAYMSLMFLIMTILSIAGSGCGWAAALTRWKRRNLRSTVTQIAFLTFVGFLNLTEGIIFWGTPGFGYTTVWATGLLTIILSLLGLILTIFV